MDTNLTAVKAALAGVADTELAAPIAATYGAAQATPGLLAWMDSAAEWELNRRRGFDYTLQQPEAASDPFEHEVSRLSGRAEAQLGSSAHRDRFIPDLLTP